MNASISSPYAAGQKSKQAVFRRTVAATSRAARWLAAPCVLALLLAAFTARAFISEPDNVLYGSIVIGTNIITAADTGMVVEARRTVDGPAIASYRMGTEPALGNFYALDIPVEAFGPATGTNASLVGDAIYIVLKDSSGDVGQAQFAIQERGIIQRLNFGAPTGDTDGDGLPDAWELSRIGNLDQNGGDDSDGDGLNNLGEWIAGLDPKIPDGFRLYIAMSGSQVQVSFLALKAEGQGYEGLSRVYTLETKPDAGSGSWTPVPGYSQVIGNNQTVLYEPASTTTTGIYRGKIALVALQTPGAPLLSIRREGDNAVLFWPSTATGFQLQQNTSPNNPSGWTWVLTSAVDDGTNMNVTVALDPTNRFFRLSLQ